MKGFNRAKELGSTLLSVMYLPEQGAFLLWYILVLGVSGKA